MLISHPGFKRCRVPSLRIAVSTSFSNFYSLWNDLEPPQLQISCALATLWWHWRTKGWLLQFWSVSLVWNSGRTAGWRVTAQGTPAPHRWKVSWCRVGWGMLNLCDRNLLSVILALIFPRGGQQSNLSFWDLIHTGMMLCLQWGSPSVRAEVLPCTAGAEQQHLSLLSTSVTNKLNYPTAAHFPISMGRNTDRQWKRGFVPSYNLEQFTLLWFFWWFHPVQYAIIYWHNREKQIHTLTVCIDNGLCIWRYWSTAKKINWSNAGFVKAADYRQLSLCSFGLLSLF